VGRAVPRGPAHLWAEGSRGGAGGAGTGMGAGAPLTEWKDRHGAGLAAFKRGRETDLRARALLLSSQAFCCDRELEHSFSARRLSAVIGVVGAEIELLG
jgi:hypothetical protein